jgi:NADH:ubiquinone oxidoreductase subunit 6 (subunit J)
MENIPTLVFYALAAALVLSAIAVVTLRSIFHSAVFLVAALSLVAGFFVLLGADFLAAAQVLVYVGGIMIIMLFVIMLSQQARDQIQRQTNDQWFWGLCAALAIAAGLERASRAWTGVGTPSTMTPTSASLGRLLLGDMLLPFEAVSLILLAALIGAVLFGKDHTS